MTTYFGNRWRRYQLNAAEQVLADLSLTRTSSIQFVACDDGEVWQFFSDDLAARAAKRGFVTARLSLGHGLHFDGLDGLVRKLLDGMTAPGASGFVNMLRGYRRKLGANAGAHFEQACQARGISGDLQALCAAWLGLTPLPMPAERGYALWRAGTPLKGEYAIEGVFFPLDARHAKSHLTELSQLLSVFGYQGLCLMVDGVHSLAHLPIQRRQTALCTLRELLDNADGAEGMVATGVLVCGKSSAFHGTRSILDAAALASRILTQGQPSAQAPTHRQPPHRPVLDLNHPPPQSGALAPEVRPADGRLQGAVNAIMRASAGLPPTSCFDELTVKSPAIDSTLDQLLSLSALQGSVFSVFCGEYGSGKTHLLMHLCERAAVDKRPVLRLPVETLDPDLGSPQRHLQRLLLHSALPEQGRPSVLDWLRSFTRHPESFGHLLAALRAISTEKTESGFAATRALKRMRHSENPAKALESYLCAKSLATKASGPNYRYDAYVRLQLWLCLLQRMHGYGGPLLLIDEAENLYKGTYTRASRRTALRSLAFYCGGSLEGACVILAITPDVLPKLQEEASELLEDTARQRTVLQVEDATIFAMRLRRAKALHIPTLSHHQKQEMLQRLAQVHGRARGVSADGRYEQFAAQVAQENHTARWLVRTAIDRLEAHWWDPDHEQEIRSTAVAHDPAGWAGVRRF